MSLTKLLTRMKSQEPPVGTFQNYDFLKKSSSGGLQGVGCHIQEKVYNNGNLISVKKYVQGAFLGKGGFAKVYQVSEIGTNNFYALKAIDKQDLLRGNGSAKLNEEIKIHSKVKHKNVVRFHRHFEDDINIYLLIDLCKNQTLTQILKRRKKLTEFEVAYYTHQILQGLEKIHSLNIVHRDLKLGNLFIDDNMQIKIGDFGLSKILKNGRSDSVCGTPNYISPEVLEKTGHSYSADIWAIGVIVYTLIIGVPPFEGVEVEDTYQNIKGVNYHFNDKSDISIDAKEFIRQILVKNPERRPKIEELKSSKFLNKYLVPQILSKNFLQNKPSQQYIESMEKSEQSKTANNTPVQNFFGARKSSQSKFSSHERTPQHLTPKLSLPSLSPNIKFEDDQSQKLRASPALAIKIPQFSDCSPRGAPRQETPKFNFPSVYVTRWVDYSAKYGLGYQLSNGSVGVVFNDNTKVIQDPQKNSMVKYYNKTNEMQRYSILEYPQDMKKKITLFQHFKKFFKSKKQKTLQELRAAMKPVSDEFLFCDKLDLLDSQYQQYENPNLCESRFSAREIKMDIGDLHVKRYVRTQNAIMFVINDKQYQIFLNDGTEIILDTEIKKLAYVGKNHGGADFGDHYVIELKKALDRKQYTKDHEMVLRLSYMKKIINKVRGVKTVKIETQKAQTQVEETRSKQPQKSQTQINNNEELIKVLTIAKQKAVPNLKKSSTEELLQTVQTTGSSAFFANSRDGASSQNSKKFIKLKSDMKQAINDIYQSQMKHQSHVNHAIKVETDKLPDAVKVANPAVLNEFVQNVPKSLCDPYAHIKEVPETPFFKETRQATFLNYQDQAKKIRAPPLTQALSLKRSFLRIESHGAMTPMQALGGVNLKNKFDSIPRDDHECQDYQNRIRVEKSPNYKQIQDSIEVPNRRQSVKIRIQNK